MNNFKIFCVHFVSWIIYNIYLSEYSSTQMLQYIIWPISTVINNVIFIPRNWVKLIMLIENVENKWNHYQILIVENY